MAPDEGERYELQKTRKFIRELEDRGSRIHAFYTRNAAELINLVPLIGPFIRANTLDTIRDRGLVRRLEELDAKCEEALQASSSGALAAVLPEIGSRIYVLLATHYQVLTSEMAQIRGAQEETTELLRSYLLLPESSEATIEPNSSFRFVTISGASASGKDVCLHKIREHYLRARTRHCETLTKYTTRSRRQSEARYYRFLREDTFRKRVTANRVLFPYTKRNVWYGFDKRQLSRSSQQPLTLFAIFTDFELLPRARRFLQEQGVQTVSILLEASRQDLVDRSWHRSLAEEDVRARIASINQDLTYLQEERERVVETYDHIVSNGNDRALNDTVAELTAIIDGLPKTDFQLLGHQAPSV